MAVKKHQLVHDNHNQLDLNTLVKYIRTLNDKPHFLAPTPDLIKNGQDIVKSLSRVTGNEELLWEILQNVEEYLLYIVNNVDHEVRHEFVTAILETFYNLISDTQIIVYPATSIVLVLLDESYGLGTMSAARWLVQQGDNGPSSPGLRASLACLYRWLDEWHSTPALGSWVQAYIKALEEKERYDILMEVSVDHVTRLFLAMEDPIGLRESVADVIFHVLSSMRESTVTLDRISPHVGHVLLSLAADSGQWGRQLLQNIVDILTTTIDRFLDTRKGAAKEMFRSRYADVIQCLERHMATHDCRYLQLLPWRVLNSNVTKVKQKVPIRKVGLLNLGNTCYMNSVLQALLYTRQFSSHVVRQMDSVPYWSKMGIIFAKMMHSVTSKLNPDEFFAIVKPPFFTRNKQHDSSEFLGYLFELLQSYEGMSERLFDYPRVCSLLTGHRLRIVSNSTQSAITANSANTSSTASTNGQSSNSSDNENGDQNSNRRSVSPNPGSSSSGSSTSANKRSSPETAVVVPPRKRFRLGSSNQRDSFIDKTFGGVLLTRIECTQCHSSSLSRDVFRDLQLAFPQKPEGWQHNVQSLLEYYCSKELLSGENMYKCNECNCLREAERSVLIETAPRYLILVIKSFKFEPKLQVQTKLLHSMYHNYTVTLPTVRSQADHSTYTLYAAVVHTGTTLDSGHYYTLAKDQGQWHIFNDENVSFTEESELNSLKRSSTPYILFYRRTDIEEGQAPPVSELPARLQETVMCENKFYVQSIHDIRLS